MQLDPSLKFLPDQGEVARHLRQLDWDSTSIGPPALWPQNLRTALSLCLSSRFPILLWWGEDFSVLYNDAYVPFLGAHKHPAALGRPGQECWSEIWPEIGPMLAGVYRSGQATWSYDEEYYFDRHLPREEVYVTFTYGPILAADGVTVQGVFCPCTETTEKIVSARRLETLRELGAQPVPAAGPAATAGRICDVLARNPRDVPFCLIYRCGDPDFELLAATGVNAQSRPAAHWPLAAVAGNGEPQTVALASLGLALPGGPWPDLAAWARILPLRWTADGSVSGVMVLGVSARRPLDSAYRDFLDLVAQHSASAIASAVAYEQEARRAEVLAELDRAKTIFFSNVSHEFRTPLTLILGPLQQALAQPSAGLERETLELLLRNALRLQKLVNSLLDFSRIEGGGMVARLQPTDLARATQEHASAFRSAMEGAGLALSVQCDAVPTVLIDRDWYERIVLNLLSNAFKYTLRGSIDVALRDSGDEVVLSVRDTGVGIARSDLANIFQRFHRGQSPAARSHEGSGIGLALVRELVKLLGGAISVDSEPGVGSVFTVTLPKKQASAADGKVAHEPVAGNATMQARQEASRWLANASPALASAGAANRPRILCADDNADLREYLRSLLAADYDVRIAADGATALRSARQDPPDLVITDIMMPGMDGLTLLQALRGDARTRTVPVILLSARAGQEARVEGLDAGADDYLVKPFSPAELQARVGAHLRLAMLRQETQAALRDANERKDEFLAMLAHELRNPLAPLHNGLHLLRHSEVDAAGTVRVHEMLARQVSHIARLVDDLLDIARINSGKILLRKAPVDLVELLRNALEASRGQIEAAGHTVSVTLPEQPVMMQADVVRLTQVVSNLLNNAAKYTDRGGHIVLKGTQDAAGEFILSVRDNGRGIPVDMLTRVFEPFVQVDGRRGSGGLGVGLTLVARLVALHGGSVRAASQGPGTGCEIVVRLPVQAASPRQVAPQGGQAAPRQKLGRILVVDDNTDSADTTAMVLQAFGAQVGVARDGRQALAMLDEFAPAVMLVDIGMPGMDGHEVARRVRSAPSGQGVVLIAMTGWGQDEDRRHSHEAGFDHHLVKPVDFPALEQLLVSLARRRQRRGPAGLDGGAAAIQAGKIR